MKRMLLATVAALGLSWVPVAVVFSCSCAMPVGPAETVAAADLAFVGTVVDSAPAPKDPKGFGGMVHYAFAVERASTAIDGSVVEVAALGGDGGAACGMTFGDGERWFVAAHRGEAGLETGLCSGNVLVDAVPDDEVEGFMAMLPVVPSAAGSPVDGSGLSVPTAVLLGGAAAIVVAAVAYVAFRRDGRTAG